MGIGYIYRYVYKGEVIYIGKSDAKLSQRIRAHAKESAFQPFIKRAEITYFCTPNSAYTHIYETYLISKYKPKLNTQMKYEGDCPFTIICPNWKVYNGRRIEKEFSHQAFCDAIANSQDDAEYDYLNNRIISGLMKEKKIISFANKELINQVEILKGRVSFYKKRLEDSEECSTGCLELFRKEQEITGYYQQLTFQLEAKLKEYQSVNKDWSDAYASLRAKHEALKTAYKSLKNCQSDKPSLFDNLFRKLVNT